MPTRLLILFAVAGMACTIAVAAGARGNRSTISAPRLPALPAKGPSPTNRCPIPATLRPAFVRAANDTGFQLSMLVAVAQVESRLQPDARSRMDARGLLQVMPATGASLKLDIDKPADNVLAGARYLRLLLDRYARTDLALAAYNVGPTTIDRAGGVLGPIGMHYVLDIEQRWSQLAGCS
jgi:peptidoglycan DL-endopeptidase CwlO